MARDTLTVIEVENYGGKIEDIEDSLTTGTGANDLEFVHPGGNAILYIQNTVGSPITTTVVGVASARTFFRAVDKTVTTAANKTSMVNIPAVGFTGSDGKVDIDFTEDTTEFGVFKFKDTP